MANWFDSVTKTLADSKLGRRQALKTIAGTVAGAAVAAYIPGSAFAKKNHCKNPGNCGGSAFTQCSKGNTNCYCFTRMDNGKGICGCNTYCSSATPCSSQSQCSKGNTCITSTGCGCSTGVCVHNCNKTCVLSGSHAGRTAA